MFILLIYCDSTTFLTVLLAHINLFLCTFFLHSFRCLWAACFPLLFSTCQDSHTVKIHTFSLTYFFLYIFLALSRFSY